jgi:aryl-alcohol dehydrogenase-like predicted oxidoreductase
MVPESCGGNSPEDKMNGVSDPRAKLGLAAGHFGLDFPVANPRGRPVETEVGEILQIAARSRVAILDTALGSGRTERVIGERLPRPCPFRVTVKTARCDRGPDHIEAEARKSLARLGLQKAHALLIEQAGDLFSPHGPAVWARMQQMRDEGLFDRIGVSVYASDDPVGIARRFRPDVVQAPVSLLDQRLLMNGALAEMAEMGTEVHLRSIFLQGLLFLPPDRVPASMAAASRGLSRVRRMIAEGRSDPLQAALGFALARPEASAVIVGVTTAAELQAVVAAAASPPPELDWGEMALEDPSPLDAGGHWAAA